MNIIVVGTGFSGAILARKIAEELDRKVLVVEKRSHIAGNMYDEYDGRGILVQRYGPHFLNTDKYEIIAFLSQYAELFPHWCKMLSYIDGRHVRLPFNFETMRQLVGMKAAQSLLTKMRKAFAGRDRVPVLEIVNHSDEEVAAYGKLLFEKAFRTYISKMWDVPPDEIDPYVLRRVPMAMNYDERYLNRDFQMLPRHGFTRMFESMLSHPNIELLMNTDALDGLTLSDGEIRWRGGKLDLLVYTGAIDELFGYRYGMLPYRALDIRYEYFDEERVLPCEIVSYPQAKGYVRKTEYRRIMFDESTARGSVVATEYPVAFDPNDPAAKVRCYPVVTEESDALYQTYLREAGRYRNLFLCGRLAEFRYYNMDVCIEHALEYFGNVKAYLAGK